MVGVGGARVRKRCEKGARTRAGAVCAHVCARAWTRVPRVPHPLHPDSHKAASPPPRFTQGGNPSTQIHTRRQPLHPDSHKAASRVQGARNAVPLSRTLPHPATAAHKHLRGTSPREAQALEHSRDTSTQEAQVYTAEQPTCPATPEAQQLCICVCVCWCVRACVHMFPGPTDPTPAHLGPHLLKRPLQVRGHVRVPRGARLARRRPAVPVPHINGGARVFHERAHLRAHT